MHTIKGIQIPYSYPQLGCTKPSFVPWSNLNRHWWSIFNRRGHLAKSMEATRHAGFIYAQQQTGGVYHRTDE
ncbi:MAG: hypothetical protein ACR2I0_07415, partial [Rhodoferax sp.]